MTAATERLGDWVVDKDQVWIHGERITDGHVAPDMRAIACLDPALARDGRWVLRKTHPSRWVGEEHPDLSDVIPVGDDARWSAVAWSAWVLRGVRVGAVNGGAVAVDHPWLSRLQTGYRVEGSATHGLLRIVREEPAPGLLSPGAVTRTAVGVVTPREIDESDPVVRAILKSLEPR
ncbi:hypothetical protein ACFRCG_03590 [Embleya sp. NPDC056575]|uniref:hypothetical protein n=1 Tax=unclassified Embleya TaxID=2699296 RepID=UPI0036C0939E